MKARWNILRLRSLTTTPPRAIAVAATMVLVLGTIGVTLASATTPSQTYAGCLKLGLVFNVAIGTNPLLPCPSGSTRISWNQTGPAGTNGANGSNGKSAYEIWLGLGNTGTPEDFIGSLRGPGGVDGIDGINGKDGLDGVSVTSDVEPAGSNCREWRLEVRRGERRDVCLQWVERGCDDWDDRDRRRGWSRHAR